MMNGPSKRRRERVNYYIANLISPEAFYCYMYE